MRFAWYFLIFWWTCDITFMNNTNVTTFLRLRSPPPCFASTFFPDRFSRRSLLAPPQLLPAVLIERLTRLLVYGNPLCGPTGEDESGECVDRVIDASIEARDGWGDHELTIVTVTGREGSGGPSKVRVDENAPASLRFV